MVTLAIRGETACMRRIVLGIVVIVHALAHANLAIWASTAGPAWLIELLWSLALLGYLAAGLGMLWVSSLVVARESGQGFLALGTIATCIGLGFVVSAFVSIYLTRKIAMWQEPQLPAGDVADEAGLMR